VKKSRLHMTANKKSLLSIGVARKRLSSFADAHIDNHEPDTPHAATHEIEADEPGRRKSM